MTLIIDPMYTEPTAGNTLIRAHILCDTAADLPAVNAYSGYTLLMGSVADDIATGDRYKMQSDGTWVRQPVPQSDTYTSTQIDTMISATLAAITTTIFQIGTELQTNDDLNTFTTAASCKIYQTSSRAIAETIQNRPDYSDAPDKIFKIIQFTANSNARFYQICITCRIAGTLTDRGHTDMYIRSYTSQGWGSWYQIPTTAVPTWIPTP